MLQDVLVFLERSTVGNGPNVCLLSISLHHAVSPWRHLSLKCVTLLF